MGTACASGQACLNGMCVPVPTDGGSSNPNACMADRDCNPMTERCVNGACRAQCFASSEVCNMVDDDCDGLVDEGCNAVDAGVVDAGVGCGPMGATCPLDGGSPNPAMCRSSADCMGTACVNGVCR